MANLSTSVRSLSDTDLLVAFSDTDWALRQGSRSVLTRDRHRCLHLEKIRRGFLIGEEDELAAELEELADVGVAANG